MRKARIPTALLALLLLAPARPARSDVEKRTRVTIRGTGSHVTIERTQAPARKHPFERSSGGVLREAVRLKQRGAEDAAVVLYLRGHQADLPAIVEAVDVRALRRAGAGPALLTVLAALTAVDIGVIADTGERRPAMTGASEPDAVVYAMPFYGGYPLSAGYGAPCPGCFASRRFSFRSRPAFLPRMHQAFHTAFTPRMAPRGRPLAP